MKPEDILKQASDIAQGKRSQHGAENSFAMIARLWSAYLQEAASMPVSITEVDVAQLMVLLKVARSVCGGHNLDNYTDQAGYSAWAGHLEVMAEVERKRDIALHEAMKNQMVAAFEFGLGKPTEPRSTSTPIEVYHAPLIFTRWD